MNNQDIQTKIDNYLLKRMTKAERQAFEAEMTADTQLKETVELQRLLVTEIQQRAFIAEIIEETKRRMGEEDKTNGVQIPFQKPIPDVVASIPTVAASRISLRKIMIVAWSAAAIFAGLFFVNQAFVNNRMDKGFTQNFSIPEVDVMRGGEYKTSVASKAKIIKDMSKMSYYSAEFSTQHMQANNPFNNMFMQDGLILLR